MDSLNYHHLRLFHAVAREGHLTRASAKLNLTPQTVSTQIRALERSIGEPLFRRSGRSLQLTEAGSVALGYADEIFTLGQELSTTLRGQPTDRPLKVLVGATDVVPKLIVHQLLKPALHMETPVRLACREGKFNELLGDLAAHRLDVVLSDSPLTQSANVRAYNHPLGECGVTFMAAAELTHRLESGFPESLDGAPALLPSEETAVRADLDSWFEQQGVTPEIIGEFEDSALLKSFGQAGEGFFAIPSVIEHEVARQYQVLPIGRTTAVKERYYAVSVERRVRHPGVATICTAARHELFN